MPLYPARMSIPVTVILLSIVASLLEVVSKIATSEEVGAAPPAQLLAQDQLLAVPLPPQSPSVPAPFQVTLAANICIGSKKKKRNRAMPVKIIASFFLRERRIGWIFIGLIGLISPISLIFMSRISPIGLIFGCAAGGALGKESR